MLDAVLLGLKILLLILLYLFIWRVVRAATTDLGHLSPGVAPEPAAPPRAPATTRAGGAVGGAGRAGTPLREAPGARPADGASAQPAFSAGAGADAHAAPRLVVERSASLAVGEEVRLQRTLTIGRSPENDIVLVDSFVSARHARIVLGDNEISVEDLGSTNGTFVNEKRIDTAVLSRWTRVRIGDTVFRYED